MTSSRAREAPGRSLNKLPRSSEARRQTAVLCFWVAVVVSIVFVLAIPARSFWPNFMPGVLGVMQLTSENNVAAWWSGVLLFILALLAYDVSALRQRAPKIARAWVILAAILTFLSADEIGSMHERIGIGSASLGIGSWTLVLPLGAVIGAALLYALLTLWRSGEDSRRYVVPLCVGFGMFGSVAVQEYVAEVVQWGTLWIRTTIEEGVELLGMIVLLRVILRATTEIAGRPAPSDRPLFTLLSDHGRNVFVALAVLIPPLTILTALATDDRGRLADWLAVVAFLTAGLVAFTPVMSGERAKRGWLICIAGLNVLASIASTTIGPAKIIRIGDVESGARVLFLALISLLIGGLWLAATETISRKLIMLVALIGVFLLVAALGSGETYSFLMTQFLAVLVLAVTYLAMKAPEKHMPEIPRPRPL